MKITIAFILGLVVGSWFNELTQPKQNITYTPPRMTDYSEEDIEFFKAMLRKRGSK